MAIIKLFVKDIRFWIILFFVVRLIGITNPPLEVAHNWRQTTVTMVARNFMEVDNNIFYPRIDIAGEKTGITGMEFPVFNYLIYLVSNLFGYQHWYGRLINLLFSSFGLIYFFRIINKYFDAKVAFNSTIVLLFSIWFAYSRKIMPDTFSVSLIIMSIYFGIQYLDSKKHERKLLDLFLFFGLSSIGMLAKIPAGILLAVLIFPFFNRQTTTLQRVVFGGVSILALAPVSIWYFVWVPYLVKEFGFWHFFMGTDMTNGLVEILNNFPDTLKHFYSASIKYVGFFMFLVGLIMAIIQRNKLILYVLVVTFLAFLVIIFKAGLTFSRHSYYIIPFTPIMALVAGFGISKIKNQKLVLIILVVIALEGLLNQQHDFRIKTNSLSLLELENSLDLISEKEDLILINSGNYPTPMYFSHRKGWVNNNETIITKQYRDELKSKGLKYIVILKNVFGQNINLELPILVNNNDYCIYQVTENTIPISI